MFQQLKTLARFLPHPTHRNITSSVLCAAAGLAKNPNSRASYPKENQAYLNAHPANDNSNTPRNVNTVRLMSISSTPMNSSAAPGITSMAQSAHKTSGDFFGVIIPDLWQPHTEAPVPIPYVPDFWESSRHKGSDAPEEISPKLLVVAAADANLSGGPSHTLLDEHTSVESANSANSSQDTSGSKLKDEGGLWDDMADDAGIPRPKELKAAFWRAFS